LGLIVDLEHHDGLNQSWDHEVDLEQRVEVASYSIGFRILNLLLPMLSNPQGVFSSRFLCSGFKGS
jgi:hypothetical protein